MENKTIFQMSDQEVQNANAKMAKLIVKKVILSVGITIAAVVVANIVAAKIDVPAED